MYFLKGLRRRALGCLAAALLASCGGGGGGGTATTTNPSAALRDNEITVTVDGGPDNAAYIANRLFTTVTVCNPGTNVCKTLDHVLVDTGSTGLRVLASELGTDVNLPKTTAANGFQLMNCAQFLDGSFLWGPVATANVQLGSKTASIPVQIAGDSSYNSTASNCSSSGTQITSHIGSGPSALGAKGILGIGNYRQDCGSYCVSNAPAAGSGYYYACTDGSCSGVASTTATLAKQVKNPVPVFSADNNGLVVVLPPVTDNSAPSLTGIIAFGIGTRDNNQPAGATLLQLQGGNITTRVNAGAPMSNSFLDTGSNGLFFDTGLTPCSVATGFYCPPAPVSFSATLSGSNGAVKSVNFSVTNAEASFQFGKHVFPNLAGPISDATTFDWGLPFFYGRSVFIGIEGSSSPLGTGPYYAF